MWTSYSKYAFHLNKHAFLVKQSSGLDFYFSGLDDSDMLSTIRAKWLRRSVLWGQNTALLEQDCLSSVESSSLFHSYWAKNWGTGKEQMPRTVLFLISLLWESTYSNHCFYNSVLIKLIWLSKMRRSVKRKQASPEKSLPVAPNLLLQCAQARMLFIRGSISVTSRGVRLLWD